MAISLLDEGAGEMDDRAYHDMLERKAIELNFHANRDYIRGTMRTLKENKDVAFNLLRLALNEARFEPAAVERVRSQLFSELQRQSASPNDIASRNWWSTAFPNHPYGRPTNGNLDTLANITAEDLKSYVQRVFARDTLKIAVVGDIDAATAGKLIDQTFGTLPAKSNLRLVPDATPQGLGRRNVIDLRVPQTVVTYGGPGIARNDPDFMAAYIVNHILGGGSFSSRLYREVREKRGLAYGVYNSLIWLHHAAVMLRGPPPPAGAPRPALQGIQTGNSLIAQGGATHQEGPQAKNHLQ